MVQFSSSVKNASFLLFFFGAFVHFICNKDGSELPAIRIKIPGLDFGTGMGVLKFTGMCG
ncbi:hypothetical protein B4098_2157 [Heyndrickxia coagulans]|uniref:Uncharacterized protein n=1 Tax=Heyndrickxia coagulans TaxID=1398 RepID=A0A150K2J8_HEYCO|nr:hypothetical protein B4098_2157 [Heyndrickxia coagulans]